MLELSSFQLEGMDTVRVHGAAVLNLTPDHLDRYAGIEDYAAAKARIFRNQEPGDFAVVNADDRWTLRMLARRAEARLRLHPSGRAASAGGPDRGSPNRSRAGFQLGFDGPAATGWRTARSAAATTWRTRWRRRCSPSTPASPGTRSRRGLDGFPGLPHRLESVRTLDGVEWVNDSKATNVDAVLTALAAFPPGSGCG